MTTIRVKHMKLVNAVTPGAADHTVIQVFGDFGRTVNLNGAGGWDHGNNQHLYTVGKWAIPGRA